MLRMTTETTETKNMNASTKFLLLALVGLAAGLLSGLFGVGGGTIMVPGLLLVGLSQREASATSLAAMPIAGLGGVVTYALAGNVHWGMGALVILGSISGALIGARLLRSLPEKLLRWAFVVFVFGIAVEQFFEVPSRVSSVSVNLPSAFGMVALGLVAGILSALLGVGGGAILVPGMSGLFGASDLVARGTSLLAIMPGAVSGTVANLKAGLVDVKAAGLIGAVALVSTPLGGLLAAFLSPQVNQWVFMSFLVLLIVKSIRDALK
ncbi:Sulfite exporter TauE/SafE [Alloscardovia macacae]|uniref:Probable membrane transporter protein n=2 Tax=Alloscardovia macacae TaxID=1160091 RepID=A0A261F428_9BIFI|nr:Sulfite exporter TauE/SafE [Alloscardovia macacae]